MRPSAPRPDPYRSDRPPERIESAAGAIPIGKVGGARVGLRRPRSDDDGDALAPGLLAASGLPPLEDAPARSVDFAARPIAGGRRAAVPLVAFVVLVTGVVGIGAIGPHVDPSDRPAIDLALVGPPSDGVDASVATLRPGPRGRRALGAPDVISLRSPAFGPVVVTTRRIYVEGAVNAPASTVEIALEARGNRVLEMDQVDLPAMWGDLRPDSAGSFATTFVLPNPRPNGTMWITVTAFGSDGLPLAGIRRAFQVGPLLEADRVIPAQPVAGTPVNPPERG